MQYSDGGTYHESLINYYLISSLEMSLLSFNHLLHLSFAWHTKRKTGEVLRILDRGAAINNTLRVRASCFSSYTSGTHLHWQLLLFDVIPTFIDIIVALVAFAIWLDWTLTLVIFIVVSAYSAFRMSGSLFESVLNPIQL